MPELLFHGAVEEVTGSMHMVNTPQGWIALDCGLYHGRRDEAEKKNRAWPVPPTEIQAVLLSHAHIDHSGRLPRLVREGFTGPIFCTPATRDLCAIMLADSAHIQEEDVFYVNKRRGRKGLPAIEPLYDASDARAAVSMMQTVSYGRWFQVVPGVLASFQDAGHILGSAGVRLEFAKNNGHAPSLFFTGDLGRPNKAIVRDPHPLPPCDTLICESTYAGRTNESVEVAQENLSRIVGDTYERGGKVIIPAFSVGRTQSIVYHLHEEIAAGRIPDHPVFVDSPLAVSATEVFLMHPECYDAEARELKALTGKLLNPPWCTYIRNVEESKRLHTTKGPYTIVSASGMCEAGRIRHHIKNNITDPKNTILIAGYQAAHTLGRRLGDGAKEVNLFHEPYRVKARVEQIHGFSAHADEDDLLRLLEPIKNETKRIYLVHGEEEGRQTFAEKLRGMGFNNVEASQPGQRVEL